MISLVAASRESPAFIDPNTQGSLAASFEAAMQAIGQVTDNVSFHSLRCSAATAAMAGSMVIEDIKHIRDWASTKVLQYLSMDRCPPVKQAQCLALCIVGQAASHKPVIPKHNVMFTPC